VASDSSEVDAALVALLLADPQLTTLMPDGVFFDVAAHGSERFVIVSQLAHEDVGMFGRRPTNRSRIS
jgi:hypothetical protein